MNQNKNIDKVSFKLEKIEKRNIYMVPDRYFEGLQAAIQKKVIKKKVFYQLPSFRLGLKLAVSGAFAVVFIIYSGFFKSAQAPTSNYNTLLSEVSTVDIVAYIEESDISTQEIINQISVDDLAMESIEAETDILYNYELDEVDINEMIDDLELYTTEI